MFCYAGSDSSVRVLPSILVKISQVELFPELTRYTSEIERRRTTPVLHVPIAFTRTAILVRSCSPNYKNGVEPPIVAAIFLPYEDGGTTICSSITIHGSISQTVGSGGPVVPPCLLLQSAPKQHAQAHRPPDRPAGRGQDHGRTVPVEDFRPRQRVDQGPDRWGDSARGQERPLPRAHEETRQDPKRCHAHE